MEGYSLIRIGENKPWDQCWRKLRIFALLAFEVSDVSTIVDDTIVREETPVVVSTSIIIEGFEAIMKESKIYQFPSQIILHHNSTSSPRTMS